MSDSSSVRVALQVKGLDVGYGKKRVVRSATLDCAGGHVSALVGPNGSGKTTLLKGLMGVLTPSSGVVRYEDRELTIASPREHVRAGMSYVEQGAKVFASLSVNECLTVAAHVRGVDDSQREHVYDLFPKLAERLHQRAGTLSGGERGMLAISMGLMQQPSVLLLDEPSIGLAPNLVTEIYRLVGDMAERLDLTVLVAEQNVRAVLPVADYLYVLRAGEIRDSLAPEDVSDEGKMREILFA